jgi:hypothetical protein
MKLWLKAIVVVATVKQRQRSRMCWRHGANAAQVKRDLAQPRAQRPRDLVRVIRYARNLFGHMTGLSELDPGCTDANRLHAIALDMLLEFMHFEEVPPPYRRKQFRRWDRTMEKLSRFKPWTNAQASRIAADLYPNPPYAFSGAITGAIVDARMLGSAFEPFAHRGQRSNRP